MRTQRLGFVGLEEDTVSACLSMLKIIDGRSSVHWDQSIPDDADVLMVACDKQEQTRRSDLSDKPCIVVYPNTYDRPASTFSLPHPFRVMQLLDVLDDVVRTLTTDTTPRNSDVHHAGSNNGLLRVVASCDQRQRRTTQRAILQSQR